MTEEIIEKDDENQDSLGKKLSTLRKSLNLTEHDIAKQIHIKTKVIYDIDNDRDISVPPVFLKGYIKSYAKIVGLAEQEYQEYLKAKLEHHEQQKMRKYSHKEKNKLNSKKIFVIIFLLILFIIGGIFFFNWQMNKKELIEVNHYVSSESSVSE